jgi:polysaccharide deacetylase family protein (PEP-CTERM system associated)
VNEHFRTMAILNAFTVDVEDYFQVSSFDKHIDRSAWDQYPSRIERNTDHLLRLLDDHSVRGTFYILGWVAERFPGLVRAIDGAGHEIGSHSFWHRLIYDLTRDQFRDDVRRSKSVLEDLVGKPVTVFRAPSFSITRRSLWSLEILVEEGFQTDSSIFPIYHDRYGIPNARPDIHRIETKAGSLWEFPPSVVDVGPLNVPVSGGGYFRVYPIKWTIDWLRQVNVLRSRPFVFYVHPWEIDPGQPRLRAGSMLSRLRHHANVSSTKDKLRRLLNEFQFGTVTDVVRQATHHDR